MTKRERKELCIVLSRLDTIRRDLDGTFDVPKVVWLTDGRAFGSRHMAWRYYNLRHSTSA